MLLIIGPHDDGTIPLVLPALAGVPVLRWDEDSYPADSCLTVAYDSDGPVPVLRAGGRRHSLADVRAIWYRPARSPAAQDFAGHQRALFLQGFWELLAARWLPGRPRTTVALAENKLVQLARAASLGLTIPPTTITNDSRELIPAWTRSDGRLIAKSLDQGRVDVDGEPVDVLYTTRVRRHDLAARHRLQRAPVILQPDVEKAVELRVTVVGEQVFAAAIDSQASRLTRQDWRHYEDPAVSYTVHELPAEVQARCVALVRGFGLSFGALDFILTPSGEYVFLELNANGEWGWIEQRTGLPIARAIASWLSAAALGAAA